MDAIDGMPTAPTSPRAGSALLELPAGSPASPSFAITPHALQHELDQLRSLRRRSLSAGTGTAPPEGAIDPDLPSSPAPTSPPPAAEHTDDDVAMPLSDLMWLPARLHPEIAPNEFRNFLRERAAAAVETAQQGAGEGAAHRQPSGKVRRQKSMLSRQVDPSAPGSADDEKPPLPMERQRSRGATGGPVDSLSIADLQRLELAAQSGDSEKQLHELLQRSLSRDGAPVAVSDSPDAPLVPHAPGSILRRTARTKIRKPSLAGDGGGHRFGPSKRGARASATESDAGSSEQDHDAEAAIVDAYTQSSPIEAPADTPFPPRSSPPPMVIPLPRQPAPIAPVPILPPFQPAPGPSRPPPPAPAPLGLPERGQRDVQIEHASSSAHSTIPPPLPSRPESPTPSVKEKEKRSKWSKLGLRSAEHDAAKRDKRAHKAAAAATVDEPPQRSESSGGFLGLFKPKHEAKEDHAAPPPAPVALSPTASGMLDPVTGTYTNFYRLPIHVERAVYRLSHIKLANPRRPLYEQVLISNRASAASKTCLTRAVMFWYLGVINRVRAINAATI